MKSYIGKKIISAKPCCKESFEHQKKTNFDGSIPESEGNETSGYMVVYPNPDGTQYVSWSPKDVFERSYRELYAEEIDMIKYNEERKYTVL